MILTSLSCYWKKVFNQINTWIVGKDLMKLHFQIEKAFYSKLYLQDITDEDHIHTQKHLNNFK